VFQNKNYLLLCGGLTGLYFVITGIQYWISDYMITHLQQPEEVVFTTFGIVSITGPVTGVVVGGNVTTKLGGYNSKRSLYLTCGIASLCLFCAVPIPFVTNFIAFVALLWLLLFCGGFILPSLTGIMLNTVEQHLKTTANSFANLNYNLLGLLPAPFVYGAIYDAGEGGNATQAMASLMFVPIIPVVTLLLAAYFLIKENRFSRKDKRRASAIDN